MQMHQLACFCLSKCFKILFGHGSVIGFFMAPLRSYRALYNKASLPLVCLCILEILIVMSACGLIKRGGLFSATLSQFGDFFWIVAC